MHVLNSLSKIILAVSVGLLAVLPACSSSSDSAAPKARTEADSSSNYIIGAGDQLQIFVWRNQELSSSIPVRPDGKISVPLIEDMQAAGRTPTELARDVEKVLSQYVQNPIVTVMVNRFVGPASQQIRVIGEAMKPHAMPYRAEITLLDVLIDVGGLTEFAAGNRALIIRKTDSGQKTIGVRVADLVKDGDISANVPMAPGDILIVPQSWF